MLANVQRESFSKRQHCVECDAKRCNYLCASCKSDETMRVSLHLEFNVKSGLSYWLVSLASCNSLTNKHLPECYVD